MTQDNHTSETIATKQKLNPFSAAEAAKSITTEVGRVCPRCKGSGICVDCKGSGQMACPNCEGTGISGRNSQGAPLPCRVCKGNKTIPCSKVCESCGGSGVITSHFQQQILEKYQSPGGSVAHRNPKVTQAIIIACALIYILQIIWPLQFRLLAFPWLSPYSFTQAPLEIWRLITAAFLHGGFLHLLCNLYCLYLIGPELEDLIGHKHFAALFICGCIGGNIASSLLNVYSGGIGASTGIFALLTGYWVYNRRWSIGLNDRAKAYGQGAILLLVIGFVMTYFMGLAVLDNWGHLGGALAGLAYAALSKRPT